MTLPDWLTLEEVVRHASGDYAALAIFGSYARGDWDHESDVDILQVSKSRRPSYQAGAYSFSVYTPENLTKMSSRGDLFVLHLMTESVIVFDPQGIMPRVFAAFEPQSSYEHLRKELQNATSLLEISRSTYALRWKAYESTAKYILRTWLYSQMHDTGNSTFSLPNVARHFSDDRILAAFRRTKSRSPDYHRFHSLMEILRHYINSPRESRWDNLEATLVDSWGNSSLTVILGLRIMNDDQRPLPYDVLEDIGPAVV